MMWLAAQLTGTPSLLSLGQSLLLAAAIVSVARALIRIGAPRRTTLVVAFGLALSPMVGALSVALWKDIPYTACLLFATARVIDLLSSRLRADNDAIRRGLVLCSLWLVAASLLRQNGLMFAVGLLVLSSFFLRRLLLGGALSLSLILFIGAVKAILFPIMDVHPSPAYATLATFSHDLAALTVAEPQSFNPSDRAILERVAPFQRWQTGYPDFGCSSVNWIFSPDFRWERAVGHERDFVRLWAKLLLDHPWKVVGNRLCAGALAWRPDSVGSLYTVSAGIDPNDQHLETVPLSKDLYELARTVLIESGKPGVQWVLWRAPPWIYLAYGTVAYASWRRKRPLFLLLVIPLAAQQLSVLPVNPAQDARYMMFSFAYAILLLPLLASLALRRPSRGSDIGTALVDECGEPVAESGHYGCAMHESPCDAHFEAPTFATANVTARRDSNGTLLVKHHGAAQGADPWDVSSITETFAMALQKRRNRQAQRILRYFGDVLALGPVLDYGSGQQALLAQLLAEGYDATGTDIGVPALGVANGVPADRFVQLGTPWAVPRQGTWTTVILLDVLEHHPDPVSFVRSLGRPRFLLVKVPLITGPIGQLARLGVRLGRPALMHALLLVDDVSPHLRYFTAAGLDRVARAAGYERRGRLNLADVGAELPDRVRGEMNVRLRAVRASAVAAGATLAVIAPLWSDTAVFLYEDASGTVG